MPKNNKHCYQPHYLARENRWVIGLGGKMTKEQAWQQVQELNKSKAKPGH